jgi:hypothetical protein
MLLTGTASPDSLARGAAAWEHGFESRWSHHRSSRYLAGYDLEIEKDRLGGRLRCEVQVLEPGGQDRDGPERMLSGGAFPSPPPEDRRGEVTPRGS